MEQWTIVTIVVTRWSDNSVVTLASNCQAVNRVGQAKGYSKKERKIIQVDEPYVVWYYNQNMGGMDRLDQPSSRETLSALRSGGCHYSCLCLILP